MPAALIALTGPLAGRTVDLPAGGLTLGRHPDNGLVLSEPAVSRFHGRLTRGEAGWQLADLGSRQGTFVNGRPIREADLAHGDLVAIGESTFFVSLEEAGSSPELAGALEIDPYRGTEIRLPVSGEAAWSPERLGEAAGSGEKALADLAHLLDLAAACPEVRTASALGPVLLPRLLAVLPADRAALLPVGSGDDFPPVYWRAGREVAAAPFAVSRTLLARLAREGEAVVYDALAGRPAPAESVATAGIRSLAAVPLGAAGRVLGALYLDRIGGATAFSADDLHLLTAMAALAAGALANALHCERLERETRRLQGAELGHGLVGESPAMRRVTDLLARAAPSASTVLVVGESGTGKELAARALHAASPRAGRPFVAINCATLSETLLESELFGHEKGAFTGAVARKTGKLEVAHGGTLFLDEVGELPLGLQAKLLRVLQERTFERVGGTEPLAVDLRLVAATNRDLARAIADGTFRADLFYRLNVISLTLPPLRERRSDIPLLAQHFAALHGSAVRGRAVGISPAARAALEAHDWPGNVRELSNAIERAVVLGQGEDIAPADLPETVLEAPPSPSADGPVPFHEALNRTKRQLILEALDACGGNVTKASLRLALHPNHLHRLITSLGLRGEV